MEKNHKHKWGKRQSGGSDLNPMITCECGAILCNPEEYFYNKGYKDGKGDNKEQTKEFIFNMLFDCYPKDMEDFNSMTENQAYRLLNKFWNKVENLTNKH